MGKLYVVGTGPGEKRFMTEEALEALSRADVIGGYHVYVDLVRPLFPDKETFTTPMTKETERCEQALKLAGEGKTVALVCSGDAGVYGMASPVLELLPAYGDKVTVEVVAGVTAALAGAAKLGAPLAHDFCVISLSDLLTPWEVIERRLSLAAQGAFAIAIYNPSSKKRTSHLKRACDILLRHLDGDTVCGSVRNIGRENTETKLLTLAALREEEVDMFTTVFIGAPATFVVNGHMVTPRGYGT